MNGHDRYMSYQVETAGPEERVVLMYDGARRFVNLASAALESGRLDVASANVGKAQRILLELSTALDMSQGELPRSLFSLYEYWSWRLTQGVTGRDPGPLHEVSAALLDLGEAWAEAARQVRALRPARSLG